MRPSNFGTMQQHVNDATDPRKHAMAFAASNWRSNYAIPFLAIYAFANVLMTVASKALFAVPSSSMGGGTEPNNSVSQLRPLNILFLMADQMRFGKFFLKNDFFVYILTLI